MLSERRALQLAVSLLRALIWYQSSLAPKEGKASPEQCHCQKKYVAIALMVQEWKSWWQRAVPYSSLPCWFILPTSTVSRYSLNKKETIRFLDDLISCKRKGG